jgi:D-inositol-3-phosphate glycosyltransferase
VSSLAVLSLHTSPLVQPGSGDSGGMNVYVRELVGALSQSGVRCSVYVRRWRGGLPDTVDVERGFRVVHVDAGPPELAKESLPEFIDEYTAGVMADIEALGDVGAVHANYWLSGVAGHAIKHALDLPLVSTFHTLARVKADTGDPEPQRRVEAEAAVIGCSDTILASSTAEAAQLAALYGADPTRIEIVAPGVDHAFFSPGDRGGARNALRVGDHPVVLFVGRIQPLKGLDVAICALAELRRGGAGTDAELIVVGGPSGADGPAELDRCRRLASDLGVAGAVRWVDPQPHHLLSTYYRAADVVLVPSRSESFGLVALEAAACGVPVVAAAVGGLRTLVEHGRTGFLVEGRRPDAFAAYAREVIENPSMAVAMAVRAHDRARRYTWTEAAARLRRIYADLTARTLVECR